MPSDLFSDMFSEGGIRRALVCVFFWLATSTAACAQEQQNCALNVLAGLDMHTLPDGTISIPVKVENRDFFFVIDTGGVISTIDPHVVDTMNLPTKAGAASEAYITASSNVTVRPRSFSIGKLTASDFSFFRLPINSRGIGGTIAPELMRSYDIDLDFASGKFNLISSNHCPGRVIYWTHSPVAIVPMTVTPGDGHMHIPVQIDGKQMQATIDTGASVSVMSMAAARKFLGLDENSADLTPLTTRLNGRALKGYSYPFKTIAFEGVDIANPYIEILTDNEMRNFGTELILGMSTLRQLHMYIAYKEGKIYLSSAMAH